ncbi:hypothetical protein [Methanococcus maripaludis]|uniref:Uncharacterized protein n=2 Tax=Methanococcus maripaludis TaxID=39152 RepID=A0A7J9PEF0_METMI|nr:hypothetical protein [Methanococcus maripaludis]MBA2861622.1 hypothetical protein [Methanococcus maripaludis]
MKRYLFLFLLFIIPTTIYANDYDVFDSVTEENMNPSLDAWDGIELVSFYYNITDGSLTFEFSNQKDNSVSFKGFDAYSKQIYLIDLPPNQITKYRVENPKLKVGNIYFAFWNSNGFITVKEAATPLTLPNKIVLISYSALGWFTAKMWAYMMILTGISLYITKKYFVERMIIGRKRHVLPYIGCSFGILALWILTMKYGLPFGWYEVLTIGKWKFTLKLPFFDLSNWNFRYLLSYGKWLYFVALYTGFWAGFKIFNPEVKNLYAIALHKCKADDTNKKLINKREFLSLPSVNRLGKTFVRYANRIYELRLPLCLPAKVTYGGDYSEDLYEVIDYTIIEPKIEYNETTFWNRVLSHLERLKDKISPKNGIIAVELSKIMNADAVDAYHFTWSLNELIDKNYEINYENMDLKRLRGNEVIAVSRVCVEKFTSVMDKFQQFSDYIIDSIKKMKKGDDPFLDEVIERVKLEGDVSGEGGQTGDSNPTGESK